MRGVVAHGDRLRVARIALGLTQEQLASRADVDVKTVRKAEQGRRIDIATLTSLAVTLQLAPQSVVLSEPSTDALKDLRRQVVEEWVAAWDAQDIDRVIALFHDDAVMHLPGGPAIPFGGSHAGKAAIRRANEAAWEMFRTTPVSNNDISIIVDRDTAILQGTKRICLPDGRQVPLTSIHVYRFEGELIREMRAEYDTLSLDGLQGSAADPAGFTNESTAG